MNINWKSVVMSALVASALGSAATWAIQTNYLGVVFIADPTTVTRQMTVNADGSINVTATGGGGGAVTIADGADVAQGTTTDGACAGDATSGCTVLQRLSRIAARITSMITALGSPFQAGGSIGNTTFGATQPTAANLNATVVGTGTFAVQAAATATEVHVGEVGGNILPITNDLTTTNATTTTGQSIGGLQTLANAVRVSGALGASGTGGMIQSVLVSFKDAVATSQIDVFFFNASPSGSTCTNDSAFILADADRDKVIGVVHVTDFTAGNTAVVAQAMNQAMPFGLASATSAFACLVARGSFAITGTANVSLVTRILRN